MAGREEMGGRNEKHRQCWDRVVSQGGKRECVGSGLVVSLLSPDGGQVPGSYSSSLGPARYCGRLSAGRHLPGRRRQLGRQAWITVAKSFKLEFSFIVTLSPLTYSITSPVEVQGRCSVNTLSSHDGSCGAMHRKSGILRSVFSFVRGPSTRQIVRSAEKFVYSDRTMKHNCFGRGRDFNFTSRRGKVTCKLC